MSYTCELGNGRHLIVDNEGGSTMVSLGSDGGSQQQSQGTGFDTGEWTKPPTLYAVGKDYVLRFETEDGPRFLGIRDHHVQSLRDEPDLKKAKKMALKKSDRAAGMKPMKPMEPMKPMRPMEPMKPMQGMRPMEMRMGDMRMSMGGGKAEQGRKFCTQCGQAVDAGARFCGACGNKVSAEQG